MLVGLLCDAYRCRVYIYISKYVQVRNKITAFQVCAGENQNNSSEKHMEAFDSKIRKEIQSCGTAGRNHVVNCSENAKKVSLFLNLVAEENTCSQSIFHSFFIFDILVIFFGV